MKYPLVYLFGMLFICCFVSRCDIEGEVDTGGLPEGIVFFSDSFETTAPNIDLLFPGDGSRWTNIQQVNPVSGDNLITLTGNRATEGTQSLRILSRPGVEPLSKIDIEKEGFTALTGQTVVVEADFFIDSDDDLSDLLLLDLECCSCWDPAVPDNKCPGIRLMMSGGNDFLSIERGKIGGETLAQTTIPFPRRTWVRISWETILAPNEDGVNILRIDGVEAIRQNGMNLPDAEVFRAAAAAEGLEFNLVEPVFYERIQIGATANATGPEVEMYVDNVRISVEE